MITGPPPKFYGTRDNLSTAAEIVDFSKEDVVGHILDLTDGEGVDASIKPLIRF